MRPARPIVRPPSSLWSRLWRHRKGSTAVEFAMVAAPFTFALFAILEIGVVFALSTTMETALTDASRRIRTGQLQSAAQTAEDFRADICARMNVFSVDCASRLRVDVQVIPNFTAPGVDDPTEGGSFDDDALQWDPGTRGDIILVRAWYAHPLITPLLESALSRLDDGKVWLTSTTAFRNEPW